VNGMVHEKAVRRGSIVRRRKMNEACSRISTTNAQTLDCRGKKRRHTQVTPTNNIYTADIANRGPTFAKTTTTA
jgi:hypothetical protein